MEQEKDKGFTVTDKRSAFKEETSKQENNETSAETSEQTPEGQQEEQQRPFHEDSLPPLPDANLLTLILSLYTHVQVCLGILPDPVTQKAQKDLQQAKYNIDLLEVLKEKTKGNLTQEEEQALDTILYEVRMAYVGVSK